MISYFYILEKKKMLFRQNPLILYKYDIGDYNYFILLFLRYDLKYVLLVNI